MRSLTASSSGSSEEMMITPLPASAKSRIMLDDLALCADVDAGRGLVHDQDPRLGAEPLGDDDLLLVAARELATGWLVERV